MINMTNCSYINMRFCTFKLFACHIKFLINLFLVK